LAARRRDRRRPRGKRLRLALLSFACALVAGEVVLRVLGYDRQYVNGVASFHEFDPELGLRGKRGFAGRFNSAEFDVTVAMDDDGFRRSAVPAPSAPGHARLFVLGDSFCWGWGVDQGEAFPDLLAARLPELELRNLGLCGTGQVIQYLLFQRHVRDDLRAGDVVLLALFENDLLDNLGQRMEEWAHARVVDGVVELVPPPPPALSKRIKNLVKDHSRLGNLIAFKVDHFNLQRRVVRAEEQAKERFELWATTGEDPRDERVELPDDSPEVVVLRHYLVRFRDDCAAAGATLGVVCIPGRTTYGEGQDDAWAEPYEAARHRAALRTCADLGLATLDLLPEIERGKREGGVERYTYGFDFHWNPAGHRMAADAIEPFLRRLRAGE